MPYFRPFLLLFDVLQSSNGCGTGAHVRLGLPADVLVPCRAVLFHVHAARIIALCRALSGCLVALDSQLWHSCRRDSNVPCTAVPKNRCSMALHPSYT